MTTPHSVSNNQVHTIEEAEVGMAQASSMHTDTTVLNTLPMRPRSRATLVPRSMVRPTQASTKITVCRTEVPSWLLLKSVR